MTTTLRSHNPAEFWRRIKNMQGKDSPSPVQLRLNDHLIQDTPAVLETFRTHWQRIHTTNEPIPHFAEHTQNINNWYLNNSTQLAPTPIIDLETLARIHLLNSPITTDEVNHVIRRLKRCGPALPASQETLHVIYQIPQLRTLLNCLTPPWPLDIFPINLK